MFARATRVTCCESFRTGGSELGRDAKEVSDRIAKREELGSTGWGNGVALRSLIVLERQPLSAQALGIDRPNPGDDLPNLGVGLE